MTEHIPGPTLRELLDAGASLYDPPLTGVAHLLRRLHDSTRTSCRRERDFAYVHAILDQNNLPGSRRKRFDRLLGAWWHGTRLDRAGCMVHGDATPGNYLFDGGICAIDFEGGPITPTRSATSASSPRNSGHRAGALRLPKTTAGA
ncbi:phosphotransferase [Methanoculleus chikugoensis]|uniref:phosphotransferase n=1 Tax=Methanoculleus chikugoensis TaxID=118126 RepID=UPI0006D2123C|nr:phosphotransferase [Methanoculleus chikugoensis]